MIVGAASGGGGGSGLTKNSSAYFWSRLMRSGSRVSLSFSEAHSAASP